MIEMDVLKRLKEIIVKECRSNGLPQEKISTIMSLIDEVVSAGDDFSEDDLKGYLHHLGGE